MRESAFAYERLSVIKLMGTNRRNIEADAFCTRKKNAKPGSGFGVNTELDVTSDYVEWSLLCFFSSEDIK